MSKTPCEGWNSQLFFSKTVEQASDQYICKSLTVLVFLAVTIKQNSFIKFPSLVNHVSCRNVLNSVGREFKKKEVQVHLKKLSER